MPPPVRMLPTDTEVADAALRLLRLLERPGALPVLQAPLLRELHYWLLAGRHGAAIRQLGWPGSHAERIARAVARLRAEFSRPWAVEELADVAGMSASAFHRHFRATTSLSPLQFLKNLRLIEARRLMLAEGTSASSAAYAVGLRERAAVHPRIRPAVRPPSRTRHGSSPPHCPGGLSWASSWLTSLPSSAR